MLSHDGEFTGGAFQAMNEGGREGPAGEMASIPFEHGDVIIFPSHKHHCVQPVTSGIRRVLVIEFWYGEERKCGHRCETHWGACGEGGEAPMGMWNRATRSYIAW
jgi:hypothetical protein